MTRFLRPMIAALALVLSVGQLPVFAKGARHASHPHRHHAQRSHHAHHKHKVHPKNPTRRPKPKHPVKVHPRPKPGKRPHAPPPRRTTTLPKPRTPGVSKPVTKKPADKPRERPREVRRFVNFNDRTHEYSFDNHWWYNFVVYPTTVSRREAFVANYNTISPPPAVTVKPPVIKANDALPISPAGSSLAVLLDRMDVDHHWLPGQEVAWRTGEPLDGSARGPASNAGGFVAAVCAQLKVPMPPPTGANLLPGTQHDWLITEGLKKGWVEVGAMEAQLLANQGWVVLAAWKDVAATADRVSGQTAIIRPSRKPVAEIAPNGPRVTEAGPHNHNDIPLKDGFPAKAWADKQVVFLAHRPG